VFDAIDQVLGLYANIAIAWIGTLVADLVINKPLGLSPAHIEFKRAHLYDINPVGVGSMLIASLLSILAHFGLFGALAQAAPPFVALGTALIMAPLLAWLTGQVLHRAQRRPVDSPGGARHPRGVRAVQQPVRDRRHGVLPGLQHADLFAVLFAGCALRRPLQTRPPGQPVRRRCAGCCPTP
jgi:hypothetical protein